MTEYKAPKLVTGIWVQEANVPNMADPVARELVQESHCPYEYWDGKKFKGIVCYKCGHEWPCPTRNALDKWTDEIK